MKHYLYTLLILAFFSCASDEPDKPNTPPQAFEVTAKTEGTDVILTWTEAVDAEGDNVTYSVEYGGTFASGLTTRTFTFKELSLLPGIVGTVVASDGKGGKTGCTFIVDPSENPYVLIPDIEFEKFLISEGYDIVQDGKVARENVRNIKRFGDFELSFEARFKNLKGIEAFESLEAISFYCPSLIEADFQHNKKLKSIRLYSRGSAMERINVSENLLLDSLIINENKLTLLDLSKNVNLRFLYCPSNFLKTLDLSKNTKLEYLSVEQNLDLSTLIIGGDLKALCIRNTKIKTVNPESYLDLIELSCDFNQVPFLDVSKHTKLKILSYDLSRMEFVDLSNNKALEYLYLGFGAISKVDLSSNTKITHLNMSNSKIKDLDLHALTSLSELYLSFSELSTIHLPKTPQLNRMYLKDCKLTSLDLRGTDINFIDIRDNAIKEICLDKPVDQYLQSRHNWYKDATATYKVCN